MITENAQNKCAVHDVADGLGHAGVDGVVVGESVVEAFI